MQALIASLSSGQKEPRQFSF